MTTYSPTDASNVVSTPAYAEFNTDIAVSVTTEATAVVIVTAPPFIPNSTDIFWVEFFAPSVSLALAGEVRIVLYDNGASISAGAATIAQIINQAAAPYATSVFASRRIVSPTAVAHAYSIRAYRVTSNGAVNGTIGGLALPGYVRVRKEV